MSSRRSGRLAIDLGGASKALLRLDLVAVGRPTGTFNVEYLQEVCDDYLCNVR